MKLHIVTIGKPKLVYAKLGWEDYLSRLQRVHQVRVTHLADKYANDTVKLQEVISGTFVVALEIAGKDMNSPQLAEFLRNRELAAKEVSFVIGGPDGLPEAFRQSVDFQWSLSRLTLPHDLAMVVTAEALFRASTILAGLPYHR
jgi:23S rRNA (pseudouridine1915-N3)-methyltransferase